MGMTTIAGPGNTIIAIPTRVTVPPTTAATTRLAVRYLRVPPPVFNAFIAGNGQGPWCPKSTPGQWGDRSGRHADKKTG